MLFKMFTLSLAVASSLLCTEWLGNLLYKQMQLYMLIHKGIIYNTCAIAGKDLDIWNICH